jgi:hypothetical protein
MEVYILINTNNAEDPILGVYDSQSMVNKMIHYFKSYPEYQLKVVVKHMEYFDRE